MADLEEAVGALAAIEELSRLNRLEPDPLRECRLVELRHAAFGELDRSPGRPNWPPDLADPFPDQIGLPELPADRLSGDAVGGGILHHGCVRVNHLLSPDDAARLRASIDRSFEARARLKEDPTLEPLVPWYVPFDPGKEAAERFGKNFVRTVDAPRALFDLVEMFMNAGVLRAVTEYFNERPAMIAHKWVLRRQPTGKLTSDFHQDGAFLGRGIRTVNCWIALSRCGDGTGKPGIEMIPRRFPSILENPEDAAFSWSLTEEATREAASGAEIVNPVFEPGDALFFDERFPHRTGVGTDLTTRYAVESWFVAPSSYPSMHTPVVL